MNNIISIMYIINSLCTLKNLLCTSKIDNKTFSMICSQIQFLLITITTTIKKSITPLLIAGYVQYCTVHNRFLLIRGYLFAF